MVALKQKVKFYKLAGVLFFTVFALLYSHVEVGMSGIESGRFATVQAVAEQGVFYIEKCNFRTVDKTIRNNHIYHDKLPFLPWIVGMAFTPLNRFAKINFVDNYHLAIYLVNFVTGAVINILLFLWLFNLFRSCRSGSLALKFILSITCVGGTWILSYSTMFNNHTPAALGVLGIITALMHYRRKNTWQAALWAGVAAGFTGLVEVPCGFFMGIAAIGAVFLTASPEKRWCHAGIVILCGILFTAFGMALNYYAYATCLPLYMGSHGVEGTFGIGRQSDPFYYWYHSLIGDRGFFSYTPFLLAGVWYMTKNFKKLSAAEYALAAGAGAFMLFYLTCTNEFGGQSYGLRYFIPVIPLLWYWGGKLFLEMPAYKWKAPLLALLLVWGGGTGLAGAYFPFCIGNEGERSPQGHFTRYFSSFGGNLLCWSYEYFPKSTFTQNLIKRHGVPMSVTYMYWSFFNQKKLSVLQRMQQDFPKFFPGKKSQGK